MSSIYKKGRDGYYYYQAYVKNDKTGKKDKRVFHALKTKDKIEAREKQLKYDQLYSKDTNRLLSVIYRNRYNKFIIIFTIFGFIFSLILKVEDNDIILPSKRLNINKLSDASPDSTKDTVLVKKLVSYSEEKEDKAYSKIQEDISIDSLTNKFRLTRVEQAPNGFKQIKVYGIIDSTISRSKDLKKICQKIKNDYKQYSNIVVCIYSDSPLGRASAKGESLIDVSKDEIAWLAMYTYNPVEGEYFDSNPEKYFTF